MLSQGHMFALLYHYTGQVGPTQSRRDIRLAFAAAALRSIDVNDCSPRCRRYIRRSLLLSGSGVDDGCRRVRRMGEEEYQLAQTERRIRRAEIGGRANRDIRWRQSNRMRMGQDYETRNNKNGNATKYRRDVGRAEEGGGGGQWVGDRSSTTTTLQLRMRSPFRRRPVVVDGDVARGMGGGEGGGGGGEGGSVVAANSATVRYRTEHR